MTGPASHWFEAVADHLGEAYLRYSFTKGTAQEVGFLVEVLGLVPGMRVLDVGCGPGRHAHALGRQGIEVVGIDVSERFVAIARRDAPAAVTFRRLDARALDYDAAFDAAISLCQGAFGLVGPGDDARVLAGMARALRPGGRLALSAFSSYFQVRHLDPDDRASASSPGVDGVGPSRAGTLSFDAATGVHHERTTIKDEAGVDAETELWTTCYTPRELSLLVAEAGLELRDLWSVEPGRYRREPPKIDSPELLVVAVKP